MVAKAGGVSGVGRPGLLTASRVKCLENDSRCGVGSAAASARFGAHESFFGEPPGLELAFAGVEGGSCGEGTEDLECASCSVTEVPAVESTPVAGGNDEATLPEAGQDLCHAVSGDAEAV
jgi:hypothetical protein